MPAIIVFLLCSPRVSSQGKRNVPDTSDREQKSLTIGNISPKQKTLRNILQKSNSNRIDGIIYIKTTLSPPILRYLLTVKKKKSTNTSYKKTIQFTALAGLGCSSILKVLWGCDILNLNTSTVTLLCGTWNIGHACWRLKVQDGKTHYIQCKNLNHRINGDNTLCKSLTPSFIVVLKLYWQEMQNSQAAVENNL